MNRIISYLLISSILAILSFRVNANENKSLLKPNYPAKALEALSKGNVPANPAADANAQAKATESLKNASLLFIENKGQLIDTEGKLHPEILFSAKSGGAQFYFTANSIQYVFTKIEWAKRKNSIDADVNPADSLEDSVKSVSTHKFTLSLEGANPSAELLKEKANPYYENYYLAHCSDGIVAKSYEKFTLKNVYPNIDWVVYGNGKGIKYEFVLAKASDASRIKLKVKDAEAKVAKDGTLEMTTSLGKVVEEKPISFQNNKEIETCFKDLGNQTFGFETTNVNPEQPITIDPSVEWATYYGAMNRDYTHNCSVDLLGNVIVSGYTYENTFPVLSGFQMLFSGGIDATLIKLSSSGTLLFATFYGGSKGDIGKSCSLDKQGNIILVGRTDSENFPTYNGFQMTLKFNFDAFVVKFNDLGQRTWATYYGGIFSDSFNHSSSDNFGNIYLVGSTNSHNFPVLNAWQPRISNKHDVVILKLNAQGERQWATYYGGSSTEGTLACSVDPFGNLIVFGSTSSNNFPVLNAFQGTNAGSIDLFLLKFSPLGNLMWATFFGGIGQDDARSCTVDQNGYIYIGGSTTSRDFPVENAYQANHNGYIWSAFAAKFSPSGNRLWATYLGGSYYNYGFGISVDNSGFVYLAGSSLSNDFPLIGLNRPGSDTTSYLYLAKFTNDGSLIWTLAHGGSANDWTMDSGIDGAGNIYVVGKTRSVDFPVVNAFQSSINGGESSFIIKFNNDPIPTNLSKDFISTRSLNVFPNPVINRLNIGRKTQARSPYLIFSMTGQLVVKGVINEFQEELDIHNLPSGNYFLQVQGYPKVKLVKE